MDKNLLYTNNKWKHVPITHAAGRAILQHVRTQSHLIQENLFASLGVAQNSDEASDPFEKAFLQAILLK